jgi:hypothetical protein
MGSLNASGIPVVSKTSLTFRNRDGTKIYKTDSTTDVDTDVAASSEDRAIGSGYIVRDNGTVTATEEKVWGIHMGGRTNDDRVASKVGNVRDIDVARPMISGVETIAIIPGTTVGHNAQKSVRHLGTKLSVGQSVGDSVVERVANSGAL